ncbi:hypothetical protein L7F22_002322 [Adiantum nelumboides]|nr:hypothetical protein [Adiantum nelumboides]
MDDNNKENKMSIDDFDFAHEDANDVTRMLVNYLVTRLQQAMSNPALQGEVQQQLHAYGILPPFQQESGPERSHGEISKRGLFTEKGVENPYQDLNQLLEGKPSSKKKDHASHEGSPSKERRESESQDESMEDVAPRRRCQRSPTPPKRKRSPHSPHRRETKREEKNSKKKKEKERKRSPSSPSSSSSSSSDESNGYFSQEKQRRGHRRSYATWKRSNKLKKFKEGGKNISFLTYDGSPELAQALQGEIGLAPQGGDTAALLMCKKFYDYWKEKAYPGLPLPGLHNSRSYATHLIDTVALYFEIVDALVKSNTPVNASSVLSALQGSGAGSPNFKGCTGSVQIDPETGSRMVSASQPAAYDFVSWVNSSWELTGRVHDATFISLQPLVRPMLTTQPADSHSKSSTRHGGLIAGVVLFSVALIVLITVSVVYLSKRRAQPKNFVRMTR